MKSIRGFSLIEMLVVMAVITLLISLLLPSLGKAKKLARDVECLSQQRQLINSVLSFSNDQLTRLPLGSRSWPHFSMLDIYEGPLRQYVGGEMKILRCPSDQGLGGIANWWQNWYSRPLDASDHIDLLPHENPEVNYSYYWYVKMYWAVNRESGVLIGQQLQQYHIEDVRHPSELIAQRCFVNHGEGPGFTGIQGSFIDAHAEWVQRERIITSCAPWYGDYNLDWTCNGIFGKDIN